MPILRRLSADPRPRGYVERNSTSLTSRRAQGLDPHPALGGLGTALFAPKFANQVCGTSATSTTTANPGFLDLFEQLIKRHL